MKKFSFIAALAALMILSSSAWAGGGYTLESLTAGYTKICNTANRTHDELAISLKARVKYYRYDMDTTLKFRDGLPNPVTAITISTADDTELWTISGSDLFKLGENDSTSAADQYSFFVGRTDPKKGPLFAGVKNEIISSARKQGIILSGFGNPDAETSTMTVNVKSAEGLPTSIKIVYETRTQKADPQVVSITEETSTTEYAAAESVKFSIKDTNGLLDSNYSFDPELAELDLERDLQTCETMFYAYPTGKSGTLTVIAELTDEEGYRVIANEAKVKVETTIAFDQAPGSDTGRQVADDNVNLNLPNLAGTSSDPRSSSWDGIDSDYDPESPGDGTADKAKVASISTTNFTAGNFTDQSAVITVKGAEPNVSVYISAKDAKSLFVDEEGEYPEEDIPLTRSNIANYGIPFRITKLERGGNTKNAETKITLTFNGAKTALKSFPITVSAYNSAMKSPATKTFKLNANPNADMQWKMSSLDLYNDTITVLANKNSERIVDISDNTDVDNSDIPPIYTVSGDGHYLITVSPAEKNGIEADITQQEFDAFGGVDSPGQVEFSGSLEKEDKESKTTFTITATNKFTGKKSSLKVTFVGKTRPVIKDKLDDGEDIERINPVKTKRVVAGKVPSVSLKATGSKTITWSLGDDDGYFEFDGTAETSGYYAAKLSDVGLSFDQKMGKFIAKGSKNDILPTVNSIGEFESLDIVVHADNGCGDGDWARVWIGITGAKPKLVTKKLTLNRTEFSAGDIAAILTASLNKNELTSTDTQGANVKFYPLNKKGKDEDTKALAALGLELVVDDNYRNYGVLRVMEGGLKASKSTTINVLMENIGAASKGSLKLAIDDPEPIIRADSDSAIALNATKTDPDEATLNLSIDDSTLPTLDSTKFSWKVVKPKGTNVKASVKADSSSKGQKAVLTLTLPKNKLTAEESDFVVQATNSISKKSGTLTVHVSANKASASASSNTETFSAAIENVTQEYAHEVRTEAHDVDSEEEVGFEVLSLPVQTGLTSGQKAFIESRGYVVVAVLPEILAKFDGQQDLDVELEENAPVGAKLMWLALPQNSEQSEDDEIADFWDEDGEPIETVPSGRKIVVSAWLRKNVIYRPLIVAEE